MDILPISDPTPGCANPLANQTGYLYSDLQMRGYYVWDADSTSFVIRSMLPPTTNSRWDEPAFDTPTSLPYTIYSPLVPRYVSAFPLQSAST